MALTIVHVACSEVLAFFSATVHGLLGLYPTSTVIQQERIRSGRTFKPRMRSWSLPLGFALQLSLWSLFFTAARADGQCYYPNGDKSFDDIPCYTDGRVSHCCGRNSICLTNGLCVSTNQPYHLSRGSCTDESWGESCPTTCVDAQRDTGVRIVWLNNTGQGSNYCCNSILFDPSTQKKDCSDVNGEPQPAFRIRDASMMLDVAALSGIVKESNNTTSSTANNTTTTDTDTDTNTTDATTKSTEKDNSNEVAIGAGVGVPLGVIALLAIGWAIWERRRRKHALSQAAIQPVVHPVIPGSPSNGTSELGVGSQKPVELSADSVRDKGM